MSPNFGSLVFTPAVKALQERYGSHQGFVDAVQNAAQQLVKERFLLKVDADADISAAEATTVLK